MESRIILWWIFCAIIGGAIGMAKGRGVSGIVWGGLLGPIGIIVVICLPNLKKQKEADASNQQLAFQRQLQHQLQHLQLQQAQSQRFEQIPRRALPLPPGYEPKVRIASNGQDLGEMPVATVKLMLKSGKLSPQDYYFDTDANDWMQLDCCPAVS